MNILIAGGNDTAVSLIWQLLNKPGFNDKIIWVAPDVYRDTIGRGSIPILSGPEDIHQTLIGKVTIGDISADPKRPDEFHDYILNQAQEEARNAGAAEVSSIHRNSYPLLGHVGDFYHELAVKIRNDPRVQAEPCNVTDFFIPENKPDQVFVIGHEPGDSGGHDTWTVDKLVLATEYYRLPPDIPHLLNSDSVVTHPYGLNQGQIEYLTSRRKKNDLRIGFIGKGADFTTGLRQLDFLQNRGLIGKLTCDIYLDPRSPLWVPERAYMRENGQLNARHDGRLVSRPYECKFATPENIRKRSSEPFQAKIRDLLIAEVAEAGKSYIYTEAAIFGSISRPETAAALVQAAAEVSPDGGNFVANLLHSIRNCSTSLKDFELLLKHNANPLPTSVEDGIVKPQSLYDVVNGSDALIGLHLPGNALAAYDLIFRPTPNIVQWTPELVRQLDAKDPLRLAYDNSLTGINKNGGFEVRPEYAGKVIGLGQPFSPTAGLEGPALAAQRIIAQIFPEKADPFYRLSADGHNGPP